MTPSFGSYIGGCLAVIGIVCARRPRRLLAAALDRAGVLRRPRPPGRCDDRGRAADRLARAARHAQHPLAGLDRRRLHRRWPARRRARLAHGAAPTGAKSPLRAVQTLALLLALAVASFTVAEWTFPSQLSLDLGMFGGDTTWYHMPFAARIAQEHSIVHLHFTDPLRLVAWFYPQSSELIHGGGDRPLQDRLALAADQPRLALDRPARRLVHRPPLQGRSRDAGRRRRSCSTPA